MNTSSTLYAAQNAPTPPLVSGSCCFATSRLRTSLSREEVGHCVTSRQSAYGSASTDWLDYGAYTVKEKTAKDGYVLDGTVHEVLVVKDQTVYTLTLQNSRVPQQPQPPAPALPTNPKTGDDSNVGLWVSLFLLAVAGLAGLGIYVNGKKQSEDENTEENENMEG